MVSSFAWSMAKDVPLSMQALFFESRSQSSGFVRQNGVVKQRSVRNVVQVTERINFSYSGHAA